MAEETQTRIERVELNSTYLYPDIEGLRKLRNEGKVEEPMPGNSGGTASSASLAFNSLEQTLFGS
jgi:hypothetical protein